MAATSEFEMADGSAYIEVFKSNTSIGWSRNLLEGVSVLREVQITVYSREPNNSRHTGVPIPTRRMSGKTVTDHRRTRLGSAV
jgi:hypothetical protein